MRNCPFCGKEVKLAAPALMYLPNEKKWSFMHHCNLKFTVMITVDSPEEILELWEGKYGEEHSAD